MASIDDMGVAALKELIVKGKLSHDGVLEKSELRDLARKAEAQIIEFKDPFNMGWDEDLGRPTNVSLLRMDEKRIHQLKVLNEATFPVVYQPRFYDQLYAQGRDWSWLANYNNDTLVGSICCRLEEAHGDRLYIMTLGVLEPYRRLGIASHLLKQAMSDAYQSPLVKVMALHMQTSDDVARNFYFSHGFEITETIESYYSALKEGYPQDKSAYLLTKNVERPSASA